MTSCHYIAVVYELVCMHNNVYAVILYRDIIIHCDMIVYHIDMYVYMCVYIHIIAISYNVRGAPLDGDAAQADALRHGLAVRIYIYIYIYMYWL